MTAIGRIIQQSDPEFARIMARARSSAQPKSGKPCVHLGGHRTDTVGAPILVKCGCSGKEREIFLPVHDCLHPERKCNGKLPSCVPKFTPTKAQQAKIDAQEGDLWLFQLCEQCDFKSIMLCPDNPRNQTKGEPN